MSEKVVRVKFNGDGFDLHEEEMIKTEPMVCLENAFSPYPWKIIRFGSILFIKRFTGKSRDS